MNLRRWVNATNAELEKKGHPWSIADKIDRAESGGQSVSWPATQKKLPRAVQATVSQLRVGCHWELGHYRRKHVPSHMRPLPAERCPRCGVLGADDSVHFLTSCPSLARERARELGLRPGMWQLTREPYRVFHFANAVRARGKVEVVLAAVIAAWKSTQTKPRRKRPPPGPG